MALPSMDPAMRAVEFENRIIKRTSESRANIEMLKRLRDANDTEQFLKDYGTNRYKAIEKAMVTAKLVSNIAATLPDLLPNHPDYGQHLVSRDQQIQKISTIYPSYGEAQVREDFSIIDAYYSGASIEEVSNKYKRSINNLLTTAMLIATNCSRIAANKPSGISESDQVCLIALINFGLSNKTLIDALYEHKEFKKQSKKAAVEMIWRDLGVVVSPANIAG